MTIQHQLKLEGELLAYFGSCGTKPLDGFVENAQPRKEYRTFNLSNRLTNFYSEPFKPEKSETNERRAYWRISDN